ncbi:MAG: hypothetical protein AAF267_22370 [Deinococcota bacterium]
MLIGLGILFTLLTGLGVFRYFAPASISIAQSTPEHDFSKVDAAQSITGRYFSEVVQDLELVIEQANDVLVAHLNDGWQVTMPVEGYRVSENRWQGDVELELNRDGMAMSVLAQFELTANNTNAEELRFNLTFEDNEVVSWPFIPLDEGDVPTANEDRETPLLLELLAYVPDTEKYRENYLSITYNHFWRMSEQSTPPLAPTYIRSQTTADASDVHLAAMRLSTSNFDLGPLFLTYSAFMAGGMTEAVGFSIFDIEASLVAGGSGEDITVLKTDAVYSDVEVALSERGFERLVVSDIPMWTRFEDGTMTVQERNTDDPFGGHLGRSARIALFPGVMVNGSFTEITTYSIEAANQQRPSLADAPDMQALVNATSTLGEIVQATFLSPFEVGIDLTKELDPRSKKATIAAQDNLGTLPLYELAMLIDFVDTDGETRHALAMLYTTQTDAEAAMEEGQKRLELFSTVIPSAGEFENLNFQSQIVQWNGLYVSLISAHYKSQPFRYSAMFGNTLFRVWMAGVHMGDFFPAYAIDSE